MDERSAIEITPKMISAAMRVLHTSGIVECPTSSDAEIVRLMLKVGLRAGDFRQITQQPLIDAPKRPDDAVDVIDTAFARLSDADRVPEIERRRAQPYPVLPLGLMKVRVHLETSDVIASLKSIFCLPDHSSPLTFQVRSRGFVTLMQQCKLHGGVRCVNFRLRVLECMEG